MIPASEALESILKHTRQLKPGISKTVDSLHRILAENVKSSIDSPPFDQSAMDGYAFRFGDHDLNSYLKCTGEIITGSSSKKEVKRGTAIRVFTGSMIPKGADSVVPKENVLYEQNEITIIDRTLLKRGIHIRKKSSQIKKGKVALDRDHRITPASIGFLLSLGISKIKTIPSPKIRIIASGNELVSGSRALKGGQIFESNTGMLEAAIRQMGIHSFTSHIVKDDEKRMQSAFKSALSSCDVLILSGGISVGEYDFTSEALNKSGVKKVFHKVAQKPGKPFYFGKRNAQLIFALPGNPASVLTCFYEYVYPSLLKMMGYENFRHLHVSRTCLDEYKKKPGMTHFLKGYADDKTVKILPGQESYILQSFAYSNCIIEVDSACEFISAGQEVQVHFIDAK